MILTVPLSCFLSVFLIELVSRKPVYMMPWGIRPTHTGPNMALVRILEFWLRVSTHLPLRQVVSRKVRVFGPYKHMCPVPPRVEFVEEKMLQVRR